MPVLLRCSVLNECLRVLLLLQKKQKIKTNSSNLLQFLPLQSLLLILLIDFTQIRLLRPHKANKLTPPHCTLSQDESTKDQQSYYQITRSEYKLNYYTIK